MPSASVKVEKSSSLEDHPIKTVMVALEKKVRNLEKRKGKLDAYKEDRSKGATLNEDQKLAVSKYSEVTTMLDFARELQKQLLQTNTDMQKLMKKQSRRDQIEKQQLELSRIRDILMFQGILNNMDAQNVRDDFLAGSNGAIMVSKEDLERLDTFYSLISSSPYDLTDNEAEKTYDEQISSASEHLVNLLDCKNKEACGSTYKEINELLHRINSSRYFDKREAEKQEDTQEESFEEEKPKEESSEVVEVEPNVSPSQPQPPAAPSQLSAAEIEASHPPPAGQYNDNLQPQNTRNTSAKFNFLQDSEIDLESPHMDPAVVIAHPMAPAPAGITPNVPYPQTNNVESVFHSAGEPVQQTHLQASEGREDFNPTQPIPSQTFTNQNYNAPLSQSFGNIQHISSNPSVLHPSHDNQTTGPPPPIPMPNQQTKTQEQSSFGTSQLTFSNTDSSVFEHTNESETLNGSTEDQLGQTSETANSGFSSHQNRSAYGTNRGNHKRGNGNRGTGNYRRGGYQNARGGGYQSQNRENYYHSNNCTGNRDMSGNFRSNRGSRGAGGMRGNRGRGGYNHNRSEQ